MCSVGWRGGCPKPRWPGRCRRLPQEPCRACAAPAKKRDSTTAGLVSVPVVGIPEHAGQQQKLAQGRDPAAWRRRRLKHLAPKGRFCGGPGLGMPGLPGIQQAHEACGSSAARYASRSRRAGMPAGAQRRMLAALRLMRWRLTCSAGHRCRHGCKGASPRTVTLACWLVSKPARCGGVFINHRRRWGGAQEGGRAAKLLLLQEQGRQGGREGCSTSHCAAQHPARSAPCCRCPCRPLLLLLLAPPCAQHPPNIQSFKSTACAWYRRRIRRQSSAPPRASPCASPFL
jgi:hypothetical protein